MLPLFRSEVIKVARGLFFAALGCSGSLGLFSAEPRKADWTIMFYVDCEGSLDDDAMKDMADLISVGSSDRVKILVQMDRGGEARAKGEWDGTLRFEIKKNTLLTEAGATHDPGEQDMGSPKALREFVEWSQARCPAERYMLVIWDHGHGTHTKIAFTAGRGQPMAAKAAETQIVRVPKMASILSATPSGNDALYLSEMESALAKLPGGKLDIVKLDACLMAMLDTAYGLSSVAKIMVASEDKIYPIRWSQASWLKPLTKYPAMSPENLARLMVRKFAKDNGAVDPWTISAISLEKIEAVASKVSVLAHRLRDDLPGSREGILAARGKFSFGADLFGVDIDYFCKRLNEQAKKGAVSNAVGKEAGIVRKALADARLLAKASPMFKKSGIAGGLMVFFPRKSADFYSAKDHKMYCEQHAEYPLRFVREECWDEFVRLFAEVKCNP